ncbi:MAG: hypothetical protein MUO21_09690 [Nitrososphaeraceae archaeon]|nr:hypothetical protein [Nitrososphaeraceae archaeon]
MQLVAYGAQDIYITGNPQITFFKVVYRRYTNFSIESIEHSFVGTPAFGNKVSAKITRNGDLLSKMYLRVILSRVDPESNNFAWVRRVGHALLKQATIEIGGTRIDKQCGTWLDVWYELARQGDHERGYDEMIGDIKKLTNYNNHIKQEYVLYVPLQFWFNRFIGLSVPLIALQYHDVYLHIEFEKVNKLIIGDCHFDSNCVTMKDASVLTNYIFLDTEERRRFALVGHEYLIEQVQFNGVEPVCAAETTYVLDFNHPTKELIWAVRNGKYSSGKSFVYYTNKDKWSVKKACKVIIEKSISLCINPESQVGGTWIGVPPHCYETVGTFNVTNKYNEYIYVNPESLTLKQHLHHHNNNGITNKIHADIVVHNNGSTKVDINNIVTTLTIADLSIPVEEMHDTRYNPCDPKVNIFSNYGIFIDGSVNPIEYALLKFNGHDRFDRREGEYFNYVQPEQHHSNTPKDGINCYSFSLYPEQHQPSGTANLSRIESSVLTIWFKELEKDQNNNQSYFNHENELYIFAHSYNILRIYAGLSGLAYVL